MSVEWKEAVYKSYSTRYIRQELEAFKKSRALAPNQRQRAWHDTHIEFLERILAYRETGSPSSPIPTES